MISGLCSKCGTHRTKLHRDHIVPKALGGGDDAENIQLLCANCHENKTLVDMRAIQASPTFKAKVSAASRARWADPDYRERQLAALRTPEESERRSTVMKSHWSTPEYKEKMARSMAIARADPDFRRKIGAANKGRPTRTKIKREQALRAWAEKHEIADYLVTTSYGRLTFKDDDPAGD